MDNESNPLTDCWEVTLKAVCVVFVRGAKNFDEAMEFAESEVSSGNYEMIEGGAVQLREREVDSSRRHANVRSEE